MSMIKVRMCDSRPFDLSDLASLDEDRLVALERPRTNWSKLNLRGLCHGQRN